MLLRKYLLLHSKSTAKRLNRKQIPNVKESQEKHHAPQEVPIVTLQEHCQETEPETIPNVKESQERYQIMHEAYDIQLFVLQQPVFTISGYYSETFALVAKPNTLRVLLSLPANLDWPLHQMDMKNAFLNRELDKEVYMDLPSGFDGGYGDDIILMGDDLEELAQPKGFLAREFEIKDRGNRHAWLQTIRDTYRMECQYMHDLFQEHLDAMHGILKYLKTTPGKRLFFGKNEKRGVEAYIDADWAGFVDDRKLTTGYCTFVWRNLVTWRSKKQNVVASSSAEAEYRALAQGTCELIWLQRLLEELKIPSVKPMNSADIWSVGCTVIEMATGKPPWSQQYQEVAALFHIGTTKSHPPIPEHLTAEAKDFLLKCLQKEPNLRPAASELLQHPFVSGEYQEPHPVFQTSVMENSGNMMATSETDHKSFPNPVIRRSNCTSSNNVCNMGSVRCSTVYPEKFSGTGPLWGANSCDDDMCQIDDKDDFIVHQSVKFGSAILSDHLNKSFNPMCEPTDDWPCKFDESPELTKSGANLSSHQTISKPAGSPRASNERENDFTFPCGPLVGDDDDEVTESKIRAFLDEKALDLKKLQTPLYEEFYNNTLNAAGPPSAVGKSHDNVTNFLNLPPKSRSPNRTPTRRLSAAVDAACISNSANHTKRGLNVGTISDRTLKEIQSPQLSEWKELLLDAQQEPVSLSKNFSERRRKWKEELDQELEKKRGKRTTQTKISSALELGFKNSKPRGFCCLEWSSEPCLRLLESKDMSMTMELHVAELLRQAGVGGKTASPKDQILNRPRERLRFAFPGK
ncbi:Mitogen-activated protein kinase kinase kinase NPK1 [Vitis vinifera]|uniref:Mitogen-activated protein kinase kinase kinase NPK1 n=1 Tax=Vitis vinifera TaxID=29760 RepID=A0A438KKQ2_VITVI|nr:Mitogen-activated protein kinase kinase kinase NPK1 [Vitis vinifera]